MAVGIGALLRPKPASSGHGRKGEVRGNGDRARAHLLVVLVGRKTACSGGATGTGGLRRRSVVAAALWRGKREMAEPGSFVGVRARSWTA